MQLRDQLQQEMDPTGLLISEQSNGSSDSTMILVSFGNPLLDMTAVVPDKKLHDQYLLPTDGQLEVTSKQRMLFKLVMQQYKVHYTAGGSALNSSRVFSWMLGEKERVLFVGGIGQDEAADKLTTIIHESGVTTRLYEMADEPTGKCVALVLATERCLCADIGAANFCPPSHVFTPDPRNGGPVSLGSPLPEMLHASMLYVEGYFITHSFDTAMKIAKFARENNKILVFNLCGSYVCENHPDELSELLPYVDILFGFVEEYKALERYVDLKALADNRDDSTSLSIVDCLPRMMQEVHTPTTDGKTLADTLHACQLSNDVSNEKEVLSNGSSVNGSPQSDGSHNGHCFDQSDVMNEDDCAAKRPGTAVPCNVSTLPATGKRSNVHSAPPNVRTPHEGTNDASCNAADHSSMRRSNGSSPCQSDVHKSSSNGSNMDDGTNLLSSDTKVVVITQGPYPLLYCVNNGIVQKKSIEPLNPNAIVDTTGAGDSFVGGFLASLCRSRNLEECIDGGIWAARHILQQKGCTLPSYHATYL
uniref:adenosine kinase n=1 Tax=Hirondellea gigas TaxID=1518452 RepID=A0A2P2I961_9CRUS